MTIVFAVVFALSVSSGIGVVVNRRPLYAALSLVVNMLSLAVLFLLLSAQFLAAAQVIVYAGAVMVLFVFVITLLNPGRDDAFTGDRRHVALGVLMGLGFTVLAATTFLSVRNPGVFAADAGQAPGDLGTIQSIGTALYTTFAFPFEVTSLILVVAAVGAVYLSRGR